MSNVHLVPFALPFELTGILHVAGPVRHGVPTAVALAGTTRADPMRDVVVVAYEWPERIAVSDKKDERERVLIDRLNADYRFEHHRPFYSDSRPGPDPPDFLCRHETASVGVECTQWVNPERVEATAAFEAVRTAVLRSSGRRFSRLRGHVVYVSLPEGGEMPDPAEVLDVLAGHDPNHPGYDGLPKDISDYPISRRGRFTVTAARLSHPPRHGFAAIAGFELFLGYPTVLEGPILWERFLTTITRKDVAGTDHLIVSVGAPVGGGLAYPGDAIGFAMVVARIEKTVISAVHLSTVLLHLWPWRAIARVVIGSTGCEWLCGGTGLPDFRAMPDSGLAS